MLFDLTTDPDERFNRAADSPAHTARLDAALKSMVDMDAVDAQAKAEDRACFAAWREQAMREGSYARHMTAVYRGNGTSARPPRPWGEDDEMRIRAWLDGCPMPLPEVDESYA